MNELFEWTNNNLTLIVSILNTVALSVLFLHFYLRAGSLLFLRDKLWHYLGGKESFYTDELEQLRKDARELEHFRFEFNVPASSIKEAKKFENWVSSNEISLSEIKQARDYIEWKNFSNLSVKNLNYQLRLKWTLARAITLYAFFATFLSIILSPYLFLHFKESKETKNFFMSLEEARFGYFFGSPILNEDTCKDEAVTSRIMSISKMTSEHISIICSAFNSEKDQAHLRNELSKQRIGLSMFAALLLFFFFSALQRSAKLNAAKRIHQRFHP